MIMSLAIAGLLAASTAAFAGEGDSCCGYQQTVWTGKPTITFGGGKDDYETDCQYKGHDDETGELMPAGA